MQSPGRIAAFVIGRATAARVCEMDDGEPEDLVLGLRRCSEARLIGRIMALAAEERAPKSTVVIIRRRTIFLISELRQ